MDIPELEPGDVRTLQCDGLEAEWRGAADELPRHGERVLVWFEEHNGVPGRADFARLDFEGGVGAWLNGNWHRPVPLSDGWITHWMPSPDAPKPHDATFEGTHAASQLRGLCVGVGPDEIIISCMDNGESMRLPVGYRELLMRELQRPTATKSL